MVNQNRQLIQDSVEMAYRAREASAQSRNLILNATRARKVDLMVYVDDDLLELIPTFIQSRTKELEKLSIAVDLGDLDAIRFLNHDLRGVALSYGFSGLDALSRQLSSALDDQAKMRQIVDDMIFGLKNAQIISR